MPMVLVSFSGKDLAQFIVISFVTSAYELLLSGRFAGGGHWSMAEAAATILLLVISQRRHGDMMGFFAQLHGADSCKHR